MVEVEETFRFIGLVIARVGTFVGHSVLFGIVPVTLLVLRPAATEAGMSALGRGVRRAGNRLEGLVQAAVVGSLLATSIALILQATLVAQAVGDGEFRPASLTAVTETSFGQWHAVRIPIYIALSILVLGRIRTNAFATDEKKSRIWWGLWALLTAVLLGTSSMSGHTVVAVPFGIALPNDVIHLLAGSTWFAGVICLLTIIPDLGRDAEGPDRIRLLASSVTRFSRVATIAIGLVAITGLTNSWLHVEAIGDLSATPYGLTLTGKILLFFAVLALGAWNHFVVRKQLERAAAAGNPTRAASVFRRTIGTEVVAGLLIMAVTAALTNLARTKEVDVPAQSTINQHFSSKGKV